MCSGRFCQALGSWRNSRALTTGTRGRLMVRVACRWAVEPVGLRHEGARPHRALCAPPDQLVGRLCMDFAEDIDAQVTTLPGGAMRRTDERCSPVIFDFLKSVVHRRKFQVGPFTEHCREQVLGKNVFSGAHWCRCRRLAIQHRRRRKPAKPMRRPLHRLDQTRARPDQARAWARASHHIADPAQMPSSWAYYC